MSKNQFFDEAREQSVVKATIVSKYFWTWAKIIIPTAKSMSGKIAYVDLFAGPGRYRDGTKPTPLLVLEQAIQDDDMRQMLVTIFNDADTTHVHSLKTAIKRLTNIGTLKYKPEVYSQAEGEEIVKMFERMQFVPMLIFVDPWSYKGLSHRLVNSVLKDWGCDCIFFFNYNRISRGRPNQIVDSHMNALFGEQRANDLRRRLESVSPHERELTIVEELAETLKEMGGKYVLPFRFKNDKGNRTNHHLIFVSKNFKGYEIMKEIMAHESSSAEQGVASFEYSPASIRQPLLFELARPLDDLEEMLLNTFAGRRVIMEQMYQEHNIGTPYVMKNYKDVLRKLEASGKIVTEPPAAKRRKYKGEQTFRDLVAINFPPRS